MTPALDRWRGARHRKRLIGPARRPNAAGKFSAMLLAAVAWALPVSPSPAAHASIPVAVADFDFNDTSGEAVDQAAEHSARVAAFGALLRDNLGASGEYRVVKLVCPEPVCTAASMPPDDFIAAARQAGAQLVVYGGIRKMSTLVQWGEVQLLDLDRNELLLRRTVTFRGDTDMAYRRAAEFVGETLRDAMPKP